MLAATIHKKVNQEDQGDNDLCIKYLGPLDNNLWLILHSYVNHGWGSSRLYSD